MFNGVQFRTIRRLIGEHYHLLFKLFHHLFGLMHRCVVLHKIRPGYQIRNVLSFRISDMNSQSKSSWIQNLWPICRDLTYFPLNGGRNGRFGEIKSLSNLGRRVAQRLGSHNYSTFIRCQFTLTWHGGLMSWKRKTTGRAANFWHGTVASTDKHKIEAKQPRQCLNRCWWL